MAQPPPSPPQKKSTQVGPAPKKHGYLPDKVENNQYPQVKSCGSRNYGKMQMS